MLHELPLSQGKVALVDDEGWAKASPFKWCASRNRNRNTFYASRWHDGAKVRLHRFLLDAPPGVEVDHENGNGLDNRYLNLRLATTAQNQWNQGLQASNTSGYKGVSYVKGRCKWLAMIRINGRNTTLGRFAIAEEAAAAYDAAALQHRGEFARTNEMLRNAS
jgi:hypothetical protein